jgi:hypothetical protein
MKKLISVFLFAAPFFLKCSGQSDSKLREIFLNLNYSEDIRTQYAFIENDVNFELQTNKADFMASGEFYAKYIADTDLYPSADSVLVHVLTCNDMSTFFNSETHSCVAIKILYYPDDSILLDAEYSRLDSTINDAIISLIPHWKNHSGATMGAYFLSDDISPFITLDKHTYKNDYLTIEYTVE